MLIDLRTYAIRVEELRRFVASGGGERDTAFATKDYTSYSEDWCEGNIACNSREPSSASRLFSGREVQGGGPEDPGWDHIITWQ